MRISFQNWWQTVAFWTSLLGSKLLLFPSLFQLCLLSLYFGESFSSIPSSAFSSFPCLLLGRGFPFLSSRLASASSVTASCVAVAPAAPGSSPLCRTPFTSFPGSSEPLRAPWKRPVSVFVSCVGGRVRPWENSSKVQKNFTSSSLNKRVPLHLFAQIFPYPWRKLLILHLVQPRLPGDSQDPFSPCLFWPQTQCQVGPGARAGAGRCPSLCMSKLLSADLSDWGCLFIP